MSDHRNTKYSAEMQDKAEWYVNGGWKEKGHIVPSKIGLTSVLGVSRQTPYSWAEQFPEFAATFEQCDNHQFIELINHGLMKTYDSAIVRLMLGNHGYHPQQIMDHRSSDHSMSPTRIELVAPDEADDNGEDQAPA